MPRAYLSKSIDDFLGSKNDEILGQLAASHGFALDPAQRDAWLVQISILRDSLEGRIGWLYFEYSVPRLGTRIDAVILTGAVIFVLEFKVGAKTYDRAAREQVWDYALDLKNFHETSHDKYVAPILIATEAPVTDSRVSNISKGDGLFDPMCSNASGISPLMDEVLHKTEGSRLDPKQWEAGRYDPTPTIIEAALALYRHHGVDEISRSDAGARNLRMTSAELEDVIRECRTRRRKAICFVTGVPGSGKTLVGLNIATRHSDRESELHSVYLSGNGPLVEILREALARDMVVRSRGDGRAIRKGEARSQVKVFVQNVHHFRDDCLDDSGPPREHVAIFDEAQRAWHTARTVDFMRRKKGRADFVCSESSYLISCMDRHADWAVVVCLVGEGQEINTGEAGIAEWLRSVAASFRHWDVYASPHLARGDDELAGLLDDLRRRQEVRLLDDLHLAVSMRSFRAEHVSNWVGQLLDIEVEAAQTTLRRISPRYPIVLTRDLALAKRWLRNQARGSERFGLVVSSSAERLKPHAIDVRSPVDPVRWFLEDRENVHSSYYLEDVATEFHVQGLELDWTCITWDADLRFGETGWDSWSFRGKRWEKIRKDERQKYLRNAYRVLLTRARQGMVLVVPQGDSGDPTRLPKFYDPTFEYLKRVGLPEI